MARARDFKAEYQRRIASAAKRGLSRSQGRGHARLGESLLRESQRNTERLEAAFRAMRQSGSQSAAAKAFNISSERLRRFVRENSLAQRSGRNWTFTDDRPREMQVISGGDIRMMKLGGFDQASLNGRHLAAVKSFLSTNDIELLREFDGQAVVDAKGKSHPLETDPNVLHRLAAQGDQVFHEIYRLVI